MSPNRSPPVTSSAYSCAASSEVAAVVLGTFAACTVIYTVEAHIFPNATKAAYFG
jgi:hypothetical protein